MNLRSLDLNLLVVFDAIYQEGSVTRAAQKVFLSQSATSNALARLRGHLKDELFLRGPEGLRPTPRAMELAPRLRAILTELKQVLEPQDFDPATDQRSVTIAAVDYFSVVVAPALMSLLAREAPGIRVQIVPLEGRWMEALDQGDVDFATPTFLDAIAPRFGQTRLIEDSYACLARKGNPLADSGPDLQRYAQASHLLVSPRGDPWGFVDDELAKVGLTRNISLVINHFTATPPIIAQTDLILTAPALFVQRMKTAQHVMFDCPVVAPVEFRCLGLVWHERLSSHPAQGWLRHAIERAAQAAQATILTG